MFDVSVNGIRSSRSSCFSVEHCKYELFNQVAYQQRRNSTSKHAKFQILRFQCERVLLRSAALVSFLVATLFGPFLLSKTFCPPVNFHSLMKLKVKQLLAQSFFLAAKSRSVPDWFCRNGEHLCPRAHLTPSYSRETLRYYSFKAVCSLKQRMWIWIGYLKSIHTQGRAGERGGMDKLSSALTARLKYRCGFH